MLQWVQTGKSLKNSQAMIRQHKTCLGCGPQGRREAFRGRTIKRASSLAGFGRTEGEETSGLNLGQNAQEVLRDSGGGKLVRVVLDDCLSSPATERSAIQQSRRFGPAELVREVRRRETLGVGADGAGKVG